MANPSFIVKVCGITTEEDASVAVEAGANALGFNFYPQSPRYVTPERARQISANVPGPYLRVGVFVNPLERDVLDTSRQVPLNVVQLHGEYCPRLPNTYRIWRSIAPTGLSGAQSEIEAYLLDTPSDQFGGSGRAFDWNLAAKHTSRILLAGGLDAANVAEAIRVAHPWGVDACSRLESSPGKKDHEATRQFVQMAVAHLSSSSSEATNRAMPRRSRPEQPQESNL